MMKRLVATLFFLSLALLALGLILPSFIDWNQHKDSILRQLSPYFYRELAVEGNISLQMIPQPEMVLEQVTVANAEGSKSGAFVTFKQLRLRVNLSSLMEGRVEIEKLDLVEPVLNLGILESGKATWTGILKEKPEVAGASVQLNQVTVTNGTLNYMNDVTGSQMKVENLNLSVAAETLLGPYQITGDMKYSGLPVNISIATEKYDGVTPFPLRIAFMPVNGLPQVRLNGVMDLQSGLDIQGEMLIEQGGLASLFNVAALNSIRFLHDTVDLRGVMEFKGSQFSLNEIKAKFGQGGELQGKISMQFFRNEKPVAHIDFEGSNLVVTDKVGDAYLNVPEVFNGDLHFKGKNIVWGGRKLAAAEISTDFDQKEWTVKSAHLYLPGSSQVRITGVVQPAAHSGAYTVQLTTADLGKLANSFSPSEKNIFKAFGDTGIVKKLTLSSSLDVSPSRFSFFNLDASFEEKMRLSGVININRTAQKPNFVAKLNFIDWDTAVFPAAACDEFLKKAMIADTDMEFTFKNLTKNGLSIPAMTFRGKSNEQGLEIQGMEGALSNQEYFTLAGHITSLAPLVGADLSYTLKSNQVPDVAKALGISLPPPLTSWENADIKGGIKGDSQKYTFTTEGTIKGNEAAFNGTAEGDAYQVTVHLKRESAGDIAGFPVEQLLGKDGAFEFSGELKGAGDNYKIEQIHSTIGTSVLSGAVEKQGEKYLADLTVNEMLWQRLHIVDARLIAETGESGLQISNLTGTVWGGKLEAVLGFTRDENQSWASRFKGSLKQTDLEKLNKLLGFAGFSAGIGDVDFDLTSPDNAIASAAGIVNIKASTLKVDRFNFGKLGDDIGNLTVVPPNLQQLVDNSLRKNGDTVFKNMQGEFKIDQGRVNIESLKLSNAYGGLNMTGAADIKKGSYRLSGNIHLSQPPGFPDLKIQRSSEAADYTVDSKSLEKFIAKSNPPPVAVQPDVPPVPSAVEALPPVQKEDANAIQDILKRLDENDVPQTP